MPNTCKFSDLTEKFLQFSFRNDAKIRPLNSNVVRINTKCLESTAIDTKPRLAFAFNAKAQVLKTKTVTDVKSTPSKFKCKKKQTKTLQKIGLSFINIAFLLIDVQKKSLCKNSNLSKSSSNYGFLSI